MLPCQARSRRPLTFSSVGPLRLEALVQLVDRTTLAPPRFKSSTDREAERGTAGGAGIGDAVLAD